MLAVQRAASKAALQRAGLGLLHALSTSTSLQAELAADGPALSDQWPRMSQPHLPQPGLAREILQAQTQTFSLQEAVQLLLRKKRKFDETIEVRFALGTDPRRGDQAVRGAAVLPHSTGRRTRVAVFAEGADAEAARKAGAEIVGDDELIAEIQAKGSGAADFDTCLAVRSIMPRLARLGRILGPRGLMPNPKMGTIVEAGGVGEAVQRAKAGRVQYKADRSAVVHAAVAKLSHSEPQVVANVCALAQALLQARPKGVKGTGMTGYMLQLHLTSTQGLGYAVSLPSLLQTMRG